MRFCSFEALLRHRAAGTPEVPAFYTEQEGRPVPVSPAAFLAAAEARASALRASGKTSAGVLCGNGYDTVLDLFAAAMAGMQLTLLNEDAAPEQVAAADVDLLLGDEDAVEELSPALTPGVSDGEGRVLFFTSGTTAKNKAVALTQESLCASAHNGGALLGLRQDDILMGMLPLDHVFGFVCGLLWGLAEGAPVALGRGARHYADDLAFFRPTVLPSVPLLAGFLTQRGLLNKELRLVLLGAGDCPPQLPRALKAQGIAVHFGYGLTETSSGVALSLGDDPYRMTVCPDDTVTLAPDGEILIASSTCMMQGYYKDPAGTAAVLRNGVLRTGDLGAIDAEGRLRVTGRKKEILVLSDGTKIFLPEYERILSAVLPGRDFAVLLYRGAPALALCGTEEERETVLQAIADVMRTVPAGHKLQALLFVNEPLPRTATGKIKRWELQQKVETT